MTMFRAIALLVLICILNLVTSETTCPDGSICDSGTCCKASSGYSCCPLDGGVCCDSGVYCCPHGMACSLKEGTCEASFQAKRNTSIKRVPDLHLTQGQMVSRILNDILPDSNEVTVKDKMCPDHRHQCSKDATCCPISRHEYGCCPYDNAVCCSDNEHCCPHGSVCNVTSAECQRRASLTTVSKNVLTSVYCPGGEQVCPNETTCCPMGDKQFGCCPLPNAVCCQDQQHCCPGDYSCSPEGCKHNTIFDYIRVAHIP